MVVENIPEIAFIMTSQRTKDKLNENIRTGHPCRANALIARWFDETCWQMSFISCISKTANVDWIKLIRR